MLIFKSVLGAFTVALIVSAAGTARAASEEGRGYLDQKVAAPSRAFELTLGTGYTQGFGELRKGAVNNVKDVASEGIGFELGAGYRLAPRWMIGASGAYQAYQAGSTPGDTSAGGAAARVDATYHFTPYTRLDPWLKAGIGYRYLCECGTSAGRAGAQLHGFDLLGVTGGLDLRVDRQIALAPVIGATLTTFVWDRSTAIADPRLSVFAFAGLQARFDISGRYAAESTPTIAAR